ncbi:MAG: hypothetical protein ACLFRP_05435 [Puniceicoccaceae bacterium]
MNLALLIFVAEIGVLILLLGFGLRFVIYDEDGPNLDSLYKKYFNGRVRKKYAEFTRSVGWLLLTLAVLYIGGLLWADFSSVTLALLGE